MSTSNRTKLILDIGTFLAFLIVMDPRTSGIAIHEWLSFALAATVVVHLLFNWSLIVEVTKRLFAKGLNGSRWNYILNWLLFMDGVLIVLSGTIISEAALPSLGITLNLGYAWRRLHDLSANLALILMGLHLAMHWNWIVTTFKRLFSRGSLSPVPAAVRSGEEGLS